MDVQIIGKDWRNQTNERPKRRGFETGTRSVRQPIEGEEHTGKCQNHQINNRQWPERRPKRSDKKNRKGNCIGGLVEGKENQKGFCGRSRKGSHESIGIVKRHTKIYMDALGYEVGDFIECEATGGPCVDIHHINPRGMGGNPSGDKDCIENLMATNREFHIKCEQKLISKEEQIQIHFDFLRERGIEFNENYFDEV